MRIKGITYDTGFLNSGTSTREPFDPEVVRREMRILEVWFCPFTNGLTQDELLALLEDCAGRAERLRQRGAEVVFLTGSEISLFTSGFLPGETLHERLPLLADPLRLRSMIGEIRARINDFLRRAVAVVRARFGGQVSYASLPLEGVDWTLFDIIATDAAYRTTTTAARFTENIRGGRPFRRLIGFELPVLLASRRRP